MNRIFNYWKKERIDLEPHRQAHQAARSPAPEQPTAGNPGGTTEGIVSIYAARAAAGLKEVE